MVVWRYKNEREMRTESESLGRLMQVKEDATNDREKTGKKIEKG